MAISAVGRNRYCSWCGAAFAPNQAWPRHCKRCNNTSYRNPLPVAVLLLPIEHGLLCVRRAIPPGLGELALPGGFIGMGESWQEAAARERLEETGLTISSTSIQDYGALTAEEGFLLVFGLGPQLAATALDGFTPNTEASALAVITQPTELAFPLHTAIVARYFANGNGA